MSRPRVVTWAQAHAHAHAHAKSSQVHVKVAALLHFYKVLADADGGGDGTWIWYMLYGIVEGRVLKWIRCRLPHVTSKCHLHAPSAGGS